MLMERFLEAAAAMEDTINVVNAMIAAGIAAAVGVVIFIKRRIGQAK